MSAAYLTLHNPSPSATRGGVVVTPWSPIARRSSITGEEQVFFHGQEIPSQVDRLDANDRSHDELAFRLPDAALSPGDEHYKTPDQKKLSVSPRAKNNDTREKERKVSVERHATGLNLRNGILDVYLNTVPESPGGKDHEHKKWFAGAFTSVQLNQFEMLDPIAADAGWPHHPEKRIQVDRVHLVRPPWDAGRSVDFELFREGWTVESVSVGPVRAVVTIASPVHHYTCRDAEKDKPDLDFECNIYRAVSLFPDQEWFSERIWVKAKKVGAASASDLWFRPRYFMLTNLSLRPDEFRYPDHPGWFAVTSEQGYGYAFATDSHAGPVWRPPLDHPDGKTRHRAFEWELGQTRYAHAVHLFHRQATRTTIADRIGDIWYNFCFKPVWAKLDPPDPTEEGDQ